MTGSRILVAACLVASASGCAIHTQAPVEEVPYDFSDADFYDRAYAPSPKYRTTYEETYVEVVELPAGERLGRAEEGVVDVADLGGEEDRNTPTREQLLVRRPR